MSFATKVTGSLSLFFSASAVVSTIGSIASAATETSPLPPYAWALIGVACAASSSASGVLWLRFGGSLPWDGPARDNKRCCYP